MEHWIQNKESPDYEISNKGRVRNIKTGRVLKTNVNSRGYMQVCLRNNNTQITRKIHRLVADTFFDGDHQGLDVNHIDGDKLNNHISNLELCTRKENIDHAIRNGLKEIPTKVKVRVIETGKVYDSLSACSKDICGDRTQIRRCLNGKEKSCKGYHFELV